MSFPVPPRRTSWPASPWSTSAPPPPRMMSAPEFPAKMSAPPRPQITSARGVPRIMSRPAVPTIVQGFDQTFTGVWPWATTGRAAIMSAVATNVSPACRNRSEICGLLNARLPQPSLSSWIACASPEIPRTGAARLRAPAGGRTMPCGSGESSSCGSRSGLGGSSSGLASAARHAPARKPKSRRSSRHRPQASTGTLSGSE